MGANPDYASRAEQAQVNAEIRATARDPEWSTDTDAIINRCQRQIVSTDRFLLQLRDYLEAVR